MDEKEWMDAAEEQKEILGGCEAKIPIWTTQENKKNIEEADERALMGVSVFLSRIYRGIGRVSSLKGEEYASDIGQFILALLEGDIENVKITHGEYNGGHLDFEEYLGGLGDAGKKKTTVH
jgi:hypothetical protein